MIERLRYHLRIMLILGIDPGTATVGLGLVKHHGSDKFESKYFGWIKTPKEDLAQKRLAQIYTELTQKLKEFKPDVVSIEKLFFATNAKTAIAVGQAMGVIMLAVAQADLPLFSYTPMQVKLVIAGSGRAEKEDVKREVRKLLSIRSPNHKKTHFDDVCDALAVAICHARKLSTPTTNTK